MNAPWIRCRLLEAKAQIRRPGGLFDSLALLRGKPQASTWPLKTLVPNDVHVASLIGTFIVLDFVKIPNFKIMFPLVLDSH